MLGCFLNQLAQREKEEDHILFLFLDRAQEEFLFPFARHKRRQDREYREQSERTRLELENEMILRQIEEKDVSIFRARIAILREVGYDDSDIRRIVWMSVGNSLSRLGKHQDTNPAFPR